MFRAQLRRQRPTVIRCLLSRNTHSESSEAFVKLASATVYRDLPDSSNGVAPLFRGLEFSLDSHGQHYAVVGPSSSVRTNLLKVLSGRYFCDPPNARTYPYLKSQDKIPDRVISYVGFDAERDGLAGTYMSARYEAHREVTDWSLLNYLEGNTELNALARAKDAVDHTLLAELVADLDLKAHLQLPLTNLSNGQTRRARIAKALLTKPELLLLDAPFMGLDPLTQQSISKFLQRLAKNSKPRVLLSLRPEDRVPDWITHVIYLGPDDIRLQGHKSSVRACISRSGIVRGFEDDRDNLQVWRSNLRRPQRASRAKEGLTDPLSRDALPAVHLPLAVAEPLVEMQGVTLSYGAKDGSAHNTVLGDWSESAEKSGLWWNVRRGERWGVFGPNGSGKTTLLSLITSDHPQTYALPIKLFGRSRIPCPGELGISIFELQSRIGHSSPEVHSYFPKHLSVRRVLESAWADTPLTKPRLTHKDDCRVDAFLRWFAPELSPTRESGLQVLSNASTTGPWRTSVEMKDKLGRLIINNNDVDWADTTTFRDLAFSSQRLVLFLRALVSSPDLIILDEALSGLDEQVRDKCLLFLSHGEKLEIQPRPVGRKFPASAFKSSLWEENDMINFGGLEERQALITISHNKEDIPGCVRQWICLPESGKGKPARVGTLSGPLEMNEEEAWERIWGMEAARDKKPKRKNVKKAAVSKLDETKGEMEPACTERPRRKNSKKAAVSKLDETVGGMEAARDEKEKPKRKSVKKAAKVPKLDETMDRPA
jgi:ABC-type molybdenum transport system ATPase subunit/photorepair protein PhrA